MMQFRGKRAAAACMACMIALLSADGTQELLRGSAYDAVLFSHQEWTGRNGAEDVFAVRREQASVNAVPFQSAAAAQEAVWDYNAREQSDYLQMLTGSSEDWQLTVVQNHNNYL